MTRFVAVGAGRMGRGIAIAFAYAGHRIALVDLRMRTPEAWQRLCEEARAEIRASLDGRIRSGWDTCHCRPPVNRRTTVRQHVRRKGQRVFL